MTTANPNDVATRVLTRWITGRVATYLNVPPDRVDITTPIAYLGLDGAALQGLVQDVEQRLGVSVDRAVLWNQPSIPALANYLTAGADPRH